MAGKEYLPFFLVIAILSIPFAYPYLSDAYDNLKIRFLLDPYYEDMILNRQHYVIAEVEGMSMYPTIKDGDLVVVMLKTHPQFNLSVGDIIVYLPVSRAGQLPFAEYFVEHRVLIAHRILKIYDTGTTKYYLVKGDNNPYEDPWTITDQDIIGKVVKIIPLESITPEIKEKLFEMW